MFEQLNNKLNMTNDNNKAYVHVSKKNKTQDTGLVKYIICVLLHGFVEHSSLIGQSQYSKVCYFYITDCCYE